MNRRGFLRGLAVAPLAIKLAPLLPPLMKSYRTYIVGQDAVLAVDAGSPWIVPATEFIGYKFHVTCTLPPNATSRIRYIEAVNAL